MPKTEVVLFAEDDGSVPLLEWLDTLKPKVRDKCIVRIERLEEMGHELRRPEADFLRDGIHELRVGFQGTNYRMLYFFHQNRAIVTHGLTKESEVPSNEIDLAMERADRFKRDPLNHTHREEL